MVLIDRTSPETPWAGSWRSNLPDAVVPQACAPCPRVASGRQVMDSRSRAFGRLQRGVAIGRRSRPVLPLVYRSASLRRVILRDMLARGDRISAVRELEIIDDGIGCAVLADLCAADWVVSRLDPAPCPVTIAWGEKETVRSPGAYDGRIPQASVITLPDVGHVPMLDDPDLVARTILSSTVVPQQEQ